MVTGFSSLSIFRQIGLLVGLAASIAIGFAVVLWSQEADYRPLIADMANIDATQAVDILQANDIPYKIDPRTGGLLVPVEKIHDARMKLASLGITNDRNIGYELLDREQTLGSSQFMENISYRRGMEGELARTITSLNSVRSARVHLALPKASVFVRDGRKPSASVFVELIPGRRLQEDQSAAIVNLVASSVPELDPAEVTIVDQNGRMLSNRDKSEESVMASHQFEYTRKLEELLMKRVSKILEPVMGRDRFQAQVSADINFTAIEQTEESYNPDLQILRSEQLMEEKRSAGTGGIGGIPGALSNQPPGAASAPEQVKAEGAGENNSAVSGNSRTQATRNYELDRTISYTRHQQGQVRRLSVAVVIDDPVSSEIETETENAEGEASSEGQENAISGWTQEELDRLTALVKGAVGYDAARGDSVTLVNAPFATVEYLTPEIEETPIWQQDWFQKIVKQALAGIMVLILVFTVIRPIMKNLASSGARQPSMALATAGSQPTSGYEPATPGTMPGQAVPGAATAGLLAGPGQGYGNEMVAVQGIVANDPQQAAQVIKNWVTEDE